MTLLPILLAAYISSLGTVLSKSFTRAFSSNSGLDVRQVLSEICKFANILSVILCLHVTAYDYSPYCLQVSFFRAQQ